MNLNETNQPWSRLAAVARNVPDARDVSAPYGFATRVAALAMAQERKVSSLFERFAVKALCAAFLLALVSVVVNYPAINSPAGGSDDDLIEDEPVAVLLDV